MNDTISISALERKAEAMQKDLEEVRTLIGLMRKHCTPSPFQSALELSASVTASMKKKLTKQQSIIEGCKAILSDGKRRFSRELLPELEKLGIHVGGKNPKSLLASYLSAADDFVSDQKLGGWTLQSILRKGRQGEVAASPRLISNGGEATYHASSAWKEGAELG
jgi:hypothetical protein